MYYQHFGLNEAPFSIAPNPDYLLMTERHQEALAHLYHGIESDAGFVLLTGDIGTGKTTVCRRFLKNLPDKTQVAFILNPCLDGLELLHAIAKELGIGNVPLNATLRQLTDSIYEFLLNSHSKGINTVLLIDEAQQLYQHVLELVRLLTNLETDTQKLLKIILVGQPELNDVLAKPELKQLSQRITARYHIKPLSVKELSSYIHFRLEKSGYSKSHVLFSPAIVQQLYRMTEGVPRLINVICDRALMGAYSQNAHTVDKRVLQKAFDETGGTQYADVPSRARSSLAFSLKVLLLSGLMIVTLALAAVFAAPYFQWKIPYIQWLTVINVPSVTDKKNSSAGTSEQKTASPLSKDNIAPLDGAADFRVAQNINSVEKPSLEAFAPEKMPSIESAPNLSDAIPPVHSKEKIYTNKNAALIDLIRHVVPGAQSRSWLGANACDDIDDTGFQCLEAVVVSWQQFKKYNRPAVITLLGESDDQFMVVTGITNTHARVLSDSASEHSLRAYDIPLLQLGEKWLGEFTYLWQPPTGFVRYIYKDSSPALINWLAKHFALLDGQSEVLANDQYNELLKQRIILFQKKHNLKEDGKAGVETLLTLQEELGIAITLESDFVPVSVNQLK